MYPYIKKLGLTREKVVLLFLLILCTMLTYGQNVGIGTNAPTQKLDVNGNIKFSGALMPNGDAGDANEVLMSSGSAPAFPVWGNPTAGQMWSTVYSTDSINLTYNAGQNPPSLLPGLTQTVTVPSSGSFDAFIYTDGGVQWMTNSDSDNNCIQTEVSIWYDGGSGGFGQRYHYVAVDNTSNHGQGLRHWSFAYVVQNIPAGTHTFQIKGRVIANAAPYSNTATFCDPNTPGKLRLASLSVVLIRR